MGGAKALTLASGTSFIALSALIIDVASWRLIFALPISIHRLRSGADDR